LKELIVGFSGHGDSETIKQGSSLPESPKRDTGILSKAHKVRKNVRVNPSINKILPKTDCISMIEGAYRNTREMDIKTQAILPPEGTFFPCQMRHNAIVIFLPNKADPLNFFLLVEFI
jgi:hypothetical protein